MGCRNGLFRQGLGRALTLDQVWFDMLLIRSFCRRGRSRCRNGIFSRGNVRSIDADAIFNILVNSRFTVDAQTQPRMSTQSFPLMFELF